MSDAYILGYIRTPFGKRKGSLKDWHPVDLAAYTVDQLLEKYDVDGSAVEDLLCGTVTQIGEQGSNIGRLVALRSEKLGESVPGVAMNRMCGSGQQALNFAAMAVKSGEADLLIAGGVENMSRVAITSDTSPDQFPEDLVNKGYVLHQGEAAERIADQWEITREEMDEFALASQERALAAIDSGFFKAETVAVPTPEGETDNLEVDEHPRRGTNMEALSGLRTVFREEGGRVTAGNSSGINDGASFLLIGSKEAAEAHGLKPLARIVRTDVIGTDPKLMLTGPIPATQRVLDKAGLTLDDIDTFEVNEAFAPVVLAWMKETGVPLEKVNPNGGAIALGHPLGASGGRLTMTALNQLERTDGRYGLITMCIGFGIGIATVIERV